MDAKKMDRITFETGKSYHIHTKNDISKLRKVHIDAVIKNTVYSPQDDWIDNAEDMIVYRYWAKNRWYWVVQPYWEICMFNNWKLTKE